MFDEVAGEGDADPHAQARVQARSPRIIFHPATGVTAQAVTQAQASLRRRILRAFVGRGLLESFEAQEMLGYKHSGFSVDTSVCIAAHDRAGLERLLRYCARPPFAMERLRKAGRELVYRCAKQHSEPAQPVPPKRPAHYLSLPVGGADCPYLRGVSFVVPDMRRADANHCLHHAQRRYPPNTGAHRGGDRAAAHHPGARTTAVDEYDAQAAEGMESVPDWDEAAQPAPDFEVDQRVSW